MTKLELVKEKLYETNASLVVLYANGEIKEYYNRRVNDILSIIKENVDALDGAVVADKVIGKAAASLLTVSGVLEIYADTISEYGKEVLDDNNVKYEYKTKTEYIQNNDKTGMCPMEEKFKDEKDLEVIYEFFLNKNI